MPPPVPLQYASGRSHARLQVNGDASGGTITVPSRGSRIGWALLWSAAALMAVSLSMALCSAAFSVGAMAFGLLGAVLTLVALALASAGAILVNVVSPGSRVRFAWGRAAGPPSEPPVLVAEGEARTGDARASGATARKLHRWPLKDVHDVRVGYGGGVKGALPNMAVHVITADGRSTSLLHDADPQEMLAVAEILRAVVGLPPRSEGRAAWLRSKAAQHAVHEPGKRAAPDASVLVLSYAGAPVRRSLVEAAYTPGLATFTACGAQLQLSAEHLTLYHSGPPLRWPCDQVYAVHAGFRGEHEPAELFLCTAGGVSPILRGCDIAMLKELAGTLNEAMGIPGKVW